MRVFLESKVVNGAALTDFLTRKWWSGDHGDHDLNRSPQYTSCFPSPAVIFCREGNATVIIYNITSIAGLWSLAVSILQFGITRTRNHLLYV
jgi:hypothetical protein